MFLPIVAFMAAVQQQPAPARVIITPANPTVIAGDSLQLRAQAVDAQGQPISGARILFNPAGMSFEASVDTTGMVHAGAVGILPVAAVAMVPGARPVTQRVEVRVVPSAAARIDVNPAAAKLVAGQQLRLHGVAYSSVNDRREDRVSWSSSATAVAQVTGAGVVTAVAPGRATLTARAGNATQTVPIEVVAGNVSAIEVSPAAANARTGDVVRFRAVVKDAAGREITGLTPTWLVSPGEGLIDDGGAFVGNRAGTYQVTASFGRRTADATVTLTPRDVHRQVKVVGKVMRSAFPTSEAWVHPNGRVAYLGTTMGGDRVYAVDISNPANPVVVDSIIVNARGINDVMTTADGNYMVITREGAADRKNGIVIADVLVHLNPNLLYYFN
jgi:hypothetical protein